MLARLARLLLVRYAGGPARAALYLSGLAALQRLVKRQPVVESVQVRPGERWVVEHLEISHERQIKQLDREEKRAKRERRAARKAARRTAS